jgi:hypothetical protein
MSELIVALTITTLSLTIFTVLRRPEAGVKLSGVGTENIQELGSQDVKLVVKFVKLPLQL